jgi:hypothetical protein
MPLVEWASAKFGLREVKEGKMGRAPHPFVIAISSILLVSPVLARPIANSDLFNKKICWNNGNIQTYGSDHNFDETYGGHGTWKISAAGVEWKTQKWEDVYRVEIDHDGTLSATNGTYNFTGHYCK